MDSQADSCSSHSQPLPVAEGRKEKPKRSRNATPSSPWTQESINLAEDDVSLDTYAPELLNEMLEERKRVFKMQVEMFEKLCRNQAEEIRIERLRDERRIMMLDSSGMSPMLQEYYHLRKKEIIDVDDYGFSIRTSHITKTCVTPCPTHARSSCLFIHSVQTNRILRRLSCVVEPRPYASLVQVPVHSVIDSIKERLPVIKYSNFLERPEGRRWDDSSTSQLCAVCLSLVNGSDEVRELCNCSHVFHAECLDGWVDQGRTTCPLCRSKLWPDLNHGRSKGSGGDPWRSERRFTCLGRLMFFL
ncbi:hypothetical protein C3L33_06267, partial [Rhododendron williamsianum]